MTRRLKKGGEARLHGLMSIGVGGHINPVDDVDRENVLLRGLERELDEEVEIEHRGGLHPVGFINDDTNGVGSVHLGLCYTLPVEGEVRVRETEKLEGGWTTAAELRGTGICSKPGRRSHSTASRIKNDQGEALTVSAQSVILET